MAERAVPAVIQEAQHYRLADWPKHLDKLFRGDVEAETNSAALGLACIPCHSNTFFKAGIASLHMAGHTLYQKTKLQTQTVCTMVFGPNQRSCSNSYPVGFCKYEKIKRFSTPPILIQLHPFKHRCHYKILASLKDQIFCVCWFFKRNTVFKPSSVFCPGLG